MLIKLTLFQNNNICELLLVVCCIRNYVNYVRRDEFTLFSNVKNKKIIVDCLKNNKVSGAG